MKSFLFSLGRPSLCRIRYALSSDGFVSGLFFVSYVLCQLYRSVAHLVCQVHLGNYLGIPSYTI